MINRIMSTRKETFKIIDTLEVVVIRADGTIEKPTYPKITKEFLEELLNEIENRKNRKPS